MCVCVCVCMYEHPPSPPTQRIKTRIDQPRCLAGLNRMLREGPVTSVYARGKGFSLRMPEHELKDWQTVNAKGKVSDLPRPAYAVSHHPPNDER